MHAYHTRFFRLPNSDKSNIQSLLMFPRSVLDPLSARSYKAYNDNHDVCMSGMVQWIRADNVLGRHDDWLRGKDALSWSHLESNNQNEGQYRGTLENLLDLLSHPSERYKQEKVGHL